MLTYVFDTSALMRFLEREAGFQEVKLIFSNADDGLCMIAISAVNWGEIVYIATKRFGSSSARQMQQRFKLHGLRVIEASEARSASAGLIKLGLGIAYADAFGVQLAGDSSDHILVTADFGVKPAEGVVNIQFLPAKPIF